MSFYRRWFLSFVLGASPLFCISQAAVAQAPAAPVPPSNSQPVGRSYVVEGAVVALLMAASGYAVGRSSRRT